jgi:polyisoprenyl-teichoic acid--peptidoglycan teichoic acid transferase
VAGKEKPYKLYRGGRVKGPVKPLREGRDTRRDGDGRDRKPVKPKRRRRVRRTIVLLLVGLVIVALVWALLGYLAVRRGVGDANERLGDAAARALAPSDGSILSTPTNILVLGADAGGRREDRQGTGRSDSIMLIRTDPGDHRISYLSLPRDLRVEIPGRGVDKINAAYSYGGPALSVQTVQNLTGLGMNHVIVVDFATFKEVIDAVGGITIQNPKPVLSNPFDCPFTGAERCARFKGWRFKQGDIELDGRRALIYARIRKNQLDPSESDITRGERQQRVLQGLTDEILGVSGFLRMPFIGDDIVKPLATDLSTNELLGLSWVRWRAAADKTLRCRFGGTPVDDGASYIQPSEDNALVIAQITGKSAPQRPPRGQPFAPGCFVGRAGG